jgi:hypothetical protein
MGRNLIDLMIAIEAFRDRGARTRVVGRMHLVKTLFRGASTMCWNVKEEDLNEGGDDPAVSVEWVEMQCLGTEMKDA